MTEPAASASPPGKGKLAVIGVVLLILLPLGAIGHFHATRNKRKHEAGALSGGQLYEAYCARCHLPSLTGNSAYPGLLAKDYTLDDFTAQVRDGKNAMPSFKATFDADDYARLHGFVAETKRGAAAPAAPTPPATSTPPR